MSFATKKKMFYMFNWLKYKMWYNMVHEEFV